jgi:hypothetical protein
MRHEDYDSLQGQDLPLLQQRYLLVYYAGPCDKNLPFQVITDFVSGRPWKKIRYL